MIFERRLTLINHRANVIIEKFYMLVYNSFCPWAKRVLIISVFYKHHQTSKVCVYISLCKLSVYQIVVEYCLSTNLECVLQ